MAIEKIPTYICDNDNCRARVMAKEWDDDEKVVEPATGYHLTAFRVHAGGGDSVKDVFACTVDCIGPAVAWSFDRISERMGG